MKKRIIPWAIWANPIWSTAKSRIGDYLASPPGLRRPKSPIRQGVSVMLYPLPLYFINIITSAGKIQLKISHLKFLYFESKVNLSSVKTLLIKSEYRVNTVHKLNSESSAKTVRIECGYSVILVEYNPYKRFKKFILNMEGSGNLKQNRILWIFVYIICLI